MSYYVFGPLLAPENKEHICLGGPYQTEEEALKAVKVNKWKAWIVGQYVVDFNPGTKVDITEFQHKVRKDIG